MAKGRVPQLTKKAIDWLGEERKPGPPPPPPRHQSYSDQASKNFEITEFLGNRGVKSLIRKRCFMEHAQACFLRSNNTAYSNLLNDSKFLITADTKNVQLAGGFKDLKGDPYEFLSVSDLDYIGPYQEIDKYLLVRAKCTQIEQVVAYPENMLPLSMTMIRGKLEHLKKTHAMPWAPLGHRGPILAPFVGENFGQPKP
ncbi:hypothetical protein RND71_012515 [Anisodus tanguticus]|uniref:Uncharacterized protein n=1 Tax=Anisodus tanguticus TaxID=243964 RepID=A0AAE1VG23_9SOLA|nr:hypothetical protein RND71_012515 [Anisodus tanguticus]